MRPTLDLLTELPDLVAEVAVTALVGAPNPGAEGGRGRRGRPDSRPPVDLAAVHACRTDDSSLLAELADLRLIICRHTTEFVPDPLEESTWTAEVSWLIAAAHAWQTQPELNDWIVSEVARIHGDLARLARVPRRRPDTCTVDGCGWPRHLVDNGKRYVCEAGHENPGPRDLLAKYRRGRAMTAKEAHADPSLRVTPAMISRAKAAGRITPARTETQGRHKVDYWLPWDLIGLAHPELVALVQASEGDGAA